MDWKTDHDVLIGLKKLGHEVYPLGVEDDLGLIRNGIHKLDFGKLAPGAHPIATSKVKWDRKYQKERNITWEIAKLPEDVERRLIRIAKRVYRSLSLNGYGRIDFRLTEEGEIYFIEANPNCDVGFDDELHLAAKASGLSYLELLQRILNLGLTYEAEWREVV